MSQEPASADEGWIAAYGFEGLYEVSDAGNVKSVRRVTTRKDGSQYALEGCILRPYTRKFGYKHVTLSRSGVNLTRTVHRLVLESFVGPRPSGLVCCHRNGIPGDNRLVNLRWDTPQANQADRLIHGTDNGGFGNPRAFLSRELIVAIREATGTHASVARWFGVSPETARRIRNGSRWAFVEVDE